MLKITKLALLVALLVSFARAQRIDVPITSTGPIRTLARNVQWTTQGQGGLENYYIFTPLYTNESICLQLVNSDTVNTHAETFAIYGTEDQQVTSYAQAPALWSPMGPVAGVPLNEQTTQLAPSTAKNYFATVAGQARVAVVFGAEASSNPTATATLLLVESPSNTANGCGNITTSLVSCPYTYEGTLLSGATGLLGLVPGAGQATYICNLIVTTSTAATAANNGVVIGAFAPPNCGTLSQTLQQYAVPAAPVLLELVGFPLIGRFTGNGVDNAGNALCLTNNTGVTLEYSYSYAQF